MDYEIDWSLIEKYECVTSYGYIPATNDARSGPTAGMGLDLGQHSDKDLKSLFPKDDKLVKKLSKFAGLKGDPAITFYKSEDGEPPIKKAIKCGPGRSAWIYLPNNKEAELELSTEELEKVNKAARQKKTDRIVSQFDLSANEKNKPLFSSLSGEAQTAIVSFQWQYGENISGLEKTDRRRKLFESFTSHNWEEAANLLENEFKRDTDKGLDRRDEEIALLQKAIKANAAEERVTAGLKQISEKLKNVTPLPAPVP